MADCIEKSENEDIQDFLAYKASKEHDFDGWEWVGAVGDGNLESRSTGSGIGSRSRSSESSRSSRDTKASRAYPASSTTFQEEDQNQDLPHLQTPPQTMVDRQKMNHPQDYTS